jgi:hypothetical protein
MVLAFILFAAMQDVSQTCKSVAEVITRKFAFDGGVKSLNILIRPSGELIIDAYFIRLCR